MYYIVELNFIHLHQFRLGEDERSGLGYFIMNQVTVSKADALNLTSKTFGYCIKKHFR